MVVTIVILGAAVVAAVAYFAAWIVAVGEARQGDSVSGGISSRRAVPSKEES